VTILPTRFYASLASVNGITAGPAFSPFNGGRKRSVHSGQAKNDERDG
jgi:hypothetical protein